MRLGKNLIKGSIFIISFIVLDLALAQVAKRVVPQWRNAVMEKEARILISPYHHGLQAFTQFEHMYGERWALFYTNSLGFRDGSPREVPLKRNGRRILIIGDSFTEGVGIPYENTFVGLIARSLKKDGIEILNAAVQTYAHQIYYTKIVHYLETLKLEVSEVVVFVDIGDMANDVNQYRFDEKGNVVRVNPNCRYGIGCRYRRTKRIKFWLKDNSILYRFYRIFRDYQRETKSRREVDPLAAATNISGVRWTFLEKEYQEYGIKGMEIADRIMSKLSDFLSRRKIDLMIVVYPWPDQIVQKDLDSKHVKFWREWSARNNADFLNLFPAFIDEHKAEEIYRKYFIPYDYHFNERGHELIASKFLAHLKK